MKIKKQVMQTVETEISLPAILKRSITANTYDIIHAYISDGAERVDVISVSGGVVKYVAFGQKAEDWKHLFDGDIVECYSTEVITATREAESMLINIARNAELIENRGIIQAAMHKPPTYGPMKPKTTGRNSCKGCKYDGKPGYEIPCVDCVLYNFYEQMEEPTDE